MWKNGYQEDALSHYLIALHHGPEESMPAMSEADMQDYMKKIQALHDEMRAAGAWVFSGALQGSNDSTVLRNEEGEIVTTDGPFVETKEQLAGFYVIDAPDRDAALEWAAKATSVVGKPLEVREFRQSET